MPRTALLLPLVWLASAQPVLAQDRIEILHYEFVEPAISEFDALGVRKPASTAADTVSFVAFGRGFSVELERNAGLGELAEKLAPGNEVVPYRGRLRAADGSWARLVHSSQGWSGLIWDGSELFGLETPHDSLAAGDRTIVFRLADVYVSPGILGCGVASDPGGGAVAVARLTEELAALATTAASLNLDLGAVADSDFSASFGADTEAALLTRFNNVDGIFSEQLGIQISVAAIDVMESGSDPFTETEPDVLLNQLAVYRGAEPQQDSQGLTHLFTGKNLDGTTVGIAFLGALCATRSPFDPQGRSFGVGLSEGRHGSVIDSLIAAHEIGHNFGAPHDAQAGSACESTPSTFLMAPAVNGSDEFSACSIDQMQAEIAAAQCLEPIPVDDLSLSPIDDSVSALAGDGFEYGLWIRNVGASNVSGATLGVTVDFGLELTGAAAGAIACAVLDNQADCALGEIAAGSDTTVTLSLLGNTQGEFALAAELSSGQDGNLANNNVDELIEVLPVVDLAISGNVSSLRSNESATLSFVLANDSASAANAVVVAVAPTSGLRVDAASVAGTACAVEAARALCELDQLTGSSSVALIVGLTALASGNESITITASAAESERNLENNVLRVALAVADPLDDEPAASNGATATKKSGGGAIDLLWLGLLGVLARRRLLQNGWGTRMLEGRARLRASRPH